MCTRRNINTVMWRCVQKLACFTLEQIRRKLSNVNKNTRCCTLQISNLYTRLRFQKAFKAFLGCFTTRYGIFTITWNRLLLQLDNHKHNIFYKIIVLRWKIVGKCAESSGCCFEPWRFPLLKIPIPHSLFSYSRSLF